MVTTLWARAQQYCPTPHPLHHHPLCSYRALYCVPILIAHHWALISNSIYNLYIVYIQFYTQLYYLHIVYILLYIFQSCVSFNRALAVIYVYIFLSCRNNNYLCYLFILHTLHTADLYIHIYIHCYIYNTNPALYKTER